MVKHFRGGSHLEWFPKTASTAYALNDMVTILSTAAGAGTLAKVTSSSTAIYGLIQRAVVSTDADYASASLVPVLVPDVDTEFEFDVTTGTPATTKIGEYVDADDEANIDLNAYTVGVVLVTGIVSSTKVIGKIAKKSGVAVGVTA
ncbi:MAG: hypothetical protein NTW30_05620 [Candidatus Aenigmarchaeota archaeon]|nr:hypothetical protein [Candidatus Aenigmarchaeota archaeon]